MLIDPILLVLIRKATLDTLSLRTIGRGVCWVCFREPIHEIHPWMGYMIHETLMQYLEDCQHQLTHSASCNPVPRCSW